MSTGVLPLSICALQHESLSAQQPVANIDTLNLLAIDRSEGMFNFPMRVTCLMVRAICAFALVLLSVEGSVWTDKKASICDSVMAKSKGGKYKSKARAQAGASPPCVNVRKH